MFELSIALKYLTPRWRQLSVSIISLISILVIALVVWLIVVFFSVTNGLEKSWIQKLIAMTAPVRVTPTAAYYQSYYYQVDSISSGSDYTLKTIGEKAVAAKSDPYDPDSDEEPPKSWPAPDRDVNGKTKDLVQLAYGAINQIPGAKARDFEMTASNLKLRVLRRIPELRYRGEPNQTQAFLNQAAYLGSLDPENPNLSQSILKVSPADLNNILDMISVASDNQDNPDTVLTLKAPEVREQLKSFFDAVTVHQLKTPAVGWNIPRTILPKEGSVSAILLKQGNRIVKVVIPQYARSASQLASDHHGESIVLQFKDGKPLYKDLELPKWVTVETLSDIPMNARVELGSIEKALNANDVIFDVKFSLQGLAFAGKVPYRFLLISKADVKQSSPFWFSQESGRLVLPVGKEAGQGILLPKTFRDAGVLLGDRGYLSYYTPTTSAVQEQRIGTFVAGFYDPGIIPLGGKFILVNNYVTSLIRSAHNQEDTTLSNGINVRLEDIAQAPAVKDAIQKTFERDGISKYWKVETYNEYDFTKDLIQQLHSDKNLFTLISTVIIIVACSNIISMLIILVNDKKLEIGILRSMGASSGSIAAIFGFCGVVMGVTGSLIGTGLALITLRHLDSLIHLISSFQGYNAFNPVFYGETLPNEVSFEALGFVVLATGAISLMAGVVPAVKACLMKPSNILRAE